MTLSSSWFGSGGRLETLYEPPSTISLSKNGRPFIHKETAGEHMYLKDRHLRDFGWQLMYTPSASRWIDTYFGAGVEFDKEPITPPPTDPDSATTTTQTHFVLETGIKFRVNITKSPLKFLSFLTEFMGLRAGIKNTGFFDINRLTHVLEFGAGVW
jgi:hypothetical protein